MGDTTSGRASGGIGLDWLALREISIRDVLGGVASDLLQDDVPGILSGAHDEQIDARRCDTGRGWVLSISSAQFGYSTEVWLSDLETEDTSKAVYRVMICIADARRESLGTRQC